MGKTVQSTTLVHTLLAAALMSSLSSARRSRAAVLQCAPLSPPRARAAACPLHVRHRRELPMEHEDADDLANLRSQVSVGGNFATCNLE